MKKIHDVFISYRRKGASIAAEELYTFLDKKGLRVFWDIEKMEKGKNFPDQISYAIECAHTFILIASHDTFAFREVDEAAGEKDYVLEEIKLACKLQKENPSERSLLVIYLPCVNPPEKHTLSEDIRVICEMDAISISSTDCNIKNLWKNALETAFSVCTKVERRTLWHAAHRWFEQSKAIGGRFANINIHKTILPNAQKKHSPSVQLPINVAADNNEIMSELPLLDALAKTEGNLFLVGEGGIGKTTALMSIMERAYDDRSYSRNDQIPVFVELSYAPDKYGALYEEGKSSFIRRSIFKQIRVDRTIRQISKVQTEKLDKVFTLPFETAVKPINSILSDTIQEEPEYLLLLDGLNEVTRTKVKISADGSEISVYEMIVGEIRSLMNEYSNVRVVLTGRIDDNSFSADSITKLHLTGIKRNAIEQYFRDKRISERKIAKILSDDNLIETLRIPMFLTMYASLNNLDGATSQGEILRLFFNEKRKNISDVEIYSQQNRIAEAERNLIESSLERQVGRMTAEMQNFILDFVLPEIAWTMERESLFYLPEYDLFPIIEKVLSDNKPTAVCGLFGKYAFDKYRVENASDKHVVAIAESIVDLGKNISKVCETVLNCTTLTLAVLQASENASYSFVHQHIRDYFAAVRNVNTLRLATYVHSQKKYDIAFECMELFYANPVSFTVRKFMGEYLGEHRNKPIRKNKKWEYAVPNEPCDKNLIERAFDIYRGKFNGECGYGVYSLVTTLCEVRQDLSGLNLSDLDLKYCVFTHDTVLGQNGCVTNVQNCKFHNSNFALVNNSYDYSCVAVNPKRPEMATVQHGYIIIWNLETSAQITTLRGNSDIGYAKYSTDGVFLISSEKGCIVIWQWDSERYSVYKIIPFETYNFLDAERLILHIDLDLKANMLCVVSSRKDRSHMGIYPTITYGYTVDIWDTSNNKKIKLLDESNVYAQTPMSYIDASGLFESSVCISNHTMITVSNLGTALIWDLKTYKQPKMLVRLDEKIHSISYSENKEKMLITTDAFIFIYDLLSNNEIKRINCSERIFYAVFSNDNDKIVGIRNTNEICVWDIKEERIIAQRNLGPVILSRVSVSNNTVVISSSNKMYILDPNTLSDVIAITNNLEHGHCVTAFSDGNKIAVSTSNTMIKIYDAYQHRFTNQLQEHNCNVMKLHMSKIDNFMLSVDKNGNAKLWNNKLNIVESFHFENMNSFILNNKNYTFIIARSSKKIHVINTKTFDKHTFNIKGDVKNIAISDNNEMIAIAVDSRIEIYKYINTAYKRQRIIKDTCSPYYVYPRSIVFFENDLFMAVHYDNHTVVVYNTVDFEPNVTLNPQVVKYRRDDSRKLYQKIRPLNPTVALDKIISSIETEKEKKSNKNVRIGIGVGLPKITREMMLFESPWNRLKKDRSPDFSYHGFMSPNNKYIAIVEEDYISIKLYDTVNFCVFTEFTDTVGAVEFIRFNSEDTLLLCAYVNSDVLTIYNIETGETRALRGHSSPVRYAHFTDDGKVTSMSNDSEIKIWDTSTCQCIETIKLVEGYNVLGVDLSNIHPESQLTDEQRRLLRQYGAKID